MCAYHPDCAHVSISYFCDALIKNCISIPAVCRCVHLNNRLHASVRKESAVYLQIMCAAHISKHHFPSILSAFNRIDDLAWAWQSVLAAAFGATWDATVEIYTA